MSSQKSPLNIVLSTPMNVIYVAGANRGCPIILEANAHLSFRSAFVCVTCAVQTLVSCGNGRARLPVGAICLPPCQNQCAFFIGFKSMSERHCPGRKKTTTVLRLFQRLPQSFSPVPHSGGAAFLRKSSV